jgi:hypothetical protein
MNSRKALNGRTGNSGAGYHSNAAIPTRYTALMRRLLDNSKRGAETLASECAEVGGLQYQTGSHEGCKKGWPLLNRLEKSDGQVRSFYRTDFDALRKSGHSDLWALAFPNEYSKGVPIGAPVPPPGETLPLFGERGR